ncbi:UNVERIFIED_CONTAM: hypothetical protein FKN15_062919 [Acipenser sinensis]
MDDTHLIRSWEVDQEIAQLMGWMQNIQRRRGEARLALQKTHGGELLLQQKEAASQACHLRRDAEDGNQAGCLGRSRLDKASLAGYSRRGCEHAGGGEEDDQEQNQSGVNLYQPGRPQPPASVEPAQPANKSAVKAGRYDGTVPWEAYQAKFCLAALANNWRIEEQAGQLAAALGGKVMQALLDLEPEEPCDFHTLTTAFQRHFGQVESAVILRNLLATRKRASGEKLGILAADTKYLARRGDPGLPPAVQEDLAMEAFIRGLNPTALRQLVWLIAPTSLEQALTHVLRTEAVLEEGERVRTPKVCAVRGKEDSDGDEDTATVRYLIRQGADVGVVNSEGETPLDIAEEEAMEELLQNEVNRQGVDIEAVRKEEERIMLRDAHQWLNSGQINDVRHAKSGGTALHVAAAKSYIEVLKLLIQAGYDVNIKDYDGWTPLHAASHWGKEEACRVLVENLCDMDTVNKVGQTAFDVADEDVLGYLEELQKKQKLLLSEKQDKKSPLIETTTTTENNQSLKPVKNKETLLTEQEKSMPRIESLEQEKVDEEEEGKKDESSCSSEEEEEEDSESETEAEKSKTTSPINNNTNSTATQPSSVTVSSPTIPTNQVTPTSPVKKFATPAGKVSPKEEERKDESPASWRSGLRKTGSYGALAEITAAKEAQKEKETTGVMRSASSPRLSSTLDNKDKDNKGTRLAYVAPTIPSRRLASTSDIDEKENRDSAASLVRSGSYTRRRWDDDLKNNEGSSSQNKMPSYQRSTSYSLAIGRSSSAREVPAKSSSAISLDPNNTKPWQPPSSQYSSYSIYRSTSNRLWSDESAEREKDSGPTSLAVIPTINTAASTNTTTATNTSTTGTVPSADGRERRRSYLTPVRDEESESQRKARSRQARQSRRSTQASASYGCFLYNLYLKGVTLTDLQEAEKTIGRGRPIRTREEEKEKEEKEKQDKEKQEDKKESETREDDYRQRYRSFEETYQRYRPTSASTATSSPLSRPNSLIGITSAYPTYSRTSRETEKEADKKEEEKEGEDKSQIKSIRDRRRPREKRRSTGVSFWTQDSDENNQELSDSEEGTNRNETQELLLVTIAADDCLVYQGLKGSELALLTYINVMYT